MSKGVHAGATYWDRKTGRFRTNRSPVWAMLKPQHRTVTSPRPKRASGGEWS